MKYALGIFGLLLALPAAWAESGSRQPLSTRPVLKAAPRGRAADAWRKAGGMLSSARVTAFERRVLQRMERLPELVSWEKGELVGHAKDSFGYPIRYALRRLGDGLSFTITRHNATYDRVGSVTFHQGSDGIVAREIHLRADSWEALFRRGSRGQVQLAQHGGRMASGTNGFTEVQTSVATPSDLALLRNMFRKRNATFAKTPFDRWYWHAAGY